MCLCPCPLPPCLVPHWWDPQPFLLALQTLFENISPCLFLRCIWRCCHLQIFHKFSCSDKSMTFEDAVHSCLYCKASFFLSFLQCLWSFLFVLMTWHPNRSMSCWLLLICVFSRNQLFPVKRWGAGGGRGGNPTPLQRILGRCNHRICDSCPISVRRADILGQVADIKGAK